MEKYKQNLHIDGNKVISYTTHVATISGRKLLVHGYWSTTTSKHINYVAKQYGLTKEDAPRNEGKDQQEDESPSMLRSVGVIAMLGDIFGSNQKESNDWKARMLKAGLEGRGLIMPDDWDTLSEDEKQRRLDAVIAFATEEVK